MAFCLTLWVNHANGDGLLGDMMPLILDPSFSSLHCQFLKVWLLGVRWCLGLVALEHHVEQSLHVHDLMFEADPDSASNAPRNLFPAMLVDIPETRADTLLILCDFIDRWPLIGDFRVSVALLWVVNIGINASFEDAVVMRRLCGRLAGGLGQLNVQKGWNVAEVEDACVPELDRLVMKLFVGQHPLGDDVPGAPECSPFIQSRQMAAGVRRGIELKRHPGLDE